MTKTQGIGNRKGVSKIDNGDDCDYEGKENRMMNPLPEDKARSKRDRSDSNSVRKTVTGLMLATVVTAALSFGAVVNAHADSPSDAAPTTAAPAKVKPPIVTPAEARAILMRMSEFIAKTQSFSVNVRSSYDVYEKSGEKIEFDQIRKITLVRPERLRVEVEESNADKHLVIYDGKEITMASLGQNVFAQSQKPGTIDDAVVYFVRDLGMKLPMAVLLLSDAPKELDQRTQKIAYVEKTSIFGVPAHHLAGRTDSVDYQIWVEDGDKPLPLRVVLTYRAEKGQPQFRAQFSDWNLAPETPAGMFAFTPPAGAHKIAFLAELPRVATAAAKRAKSKKTGGKK
jgi:hypothetical protein